MSSRRFRFAAGVLAALLVPAGFGSPALAGKLLRWKFRAGDRLHVRLTQTSEQHARVGSRPVTMSIEMTMEMDWIVDGTDAQGNGRITQSISRMAVKMDVSQGAPIRYDSARGTEPEGLAKDIAERVGPLIGAEFHLTMSGRGEIVDVQLSDEAAKTLGQAPAADRLKHLLTKQGLTQTLRQAAAVLPQQPVGPGDSWTVSATTRSPVGLVNQVHTYTYQGTAEHDGRPLEKISVETTLKLSRAAGGEGSSIRLKDQEQSGYLLFDAEAGRFVFAQIRQRLATETPFRDGAVPVQLDSSLQMRITPAVGKEGRAGRAP